MRSIEPRRTFAGAAALTNARTPFHPLFSFVCSPTCTLHRDVATHPSAPAHALTPRGVKPELLVPLLKGNGVAMLAQNKIFSAK
jgi:hypothetical protein